MAKASTMSSRIAAAQKNQSQLMTSGRSGNNLFGAAPKTLSKGGKSRLGATSRGKSVPSSSGKNGNSNVKGKPSGK